MRVLLRLFGKDSSKEFFSSLPDSSIKSVSISFLKIACFTMAFGIIGYLNGVGWNSIFQLNLSDESQLLVSWFFAYAAILYFSVRYFFPSRIELKRLYTSLPRKTVILHVFLLSLFLFCLCLVTTTVDFLRNPSAATTIVESFSEVEEETTGMGIIPIFLTLWMMVGFAEELLFRGGIHRHIRKRYGKWVAIGITTVLFTILHPLDYGKAFFTICLCLTYTLYMEYKNNLLTISILHMLQDLLFAGLSGYGAAKIALYIEPGTKLVLD